MLQQKATLPEFKIQMAGTDDIACMKLSAIASRGSRKDFVDLHYLIKHFHSLEDYLRLYMKKFANRDIGHVVRSLVYFVDAEAEPEIRMIKPVIWQDLKTDFEKWVKDLDSYQLSSVQKAQEIFYNALKANDTKGFQRMNGGSTFYSRKAAKPQRKKL